MVIETFARLYAMKLIETSIAKEWLNAETRGKIIHSPLWILYNTLYDGIASAQFERESIWYFAIIFIGPLSFGLVGHYCDFEIWLLIFIPYTLLFTEPKTITKQNQTKSSKNCIAI